LAGAIYNATGIFDGTTFNNLSYAHTLAGGTLSASNIGTLAGTDNLAPELLLTGKTVDDVVGSLIQGSPKSPGFGGGF
jgi:hypothetical protein